MEFMESIRAAFKELILPELDRIKEENREIRAILEVTNKRLDDVNIHLADQSRRIDSLRGELNSEISSLRSELGSEISSLRSELGSEISSVRSELGSEINSLRSELGSEISSVRSELGSEINSVRTELVSEIKSVRSELGSEVSSLRTELVSELKETNKRIDRLYEVIVRRDEHSQVVQRLTTLERDMEEIKRRFAA